MTAGLTRRASAAISAATGASGVVSSTVMRRRRPRGPCWPPPGRQPARTGRRGAARGPASVTDHADQRRQVAANPAATASPPGRNTAGFGEQQASGEHGHAGGESPTARRGAGSVGQQEHRPELLGDRHVGEPGANRRRGGAWARTRWGSRGEPAGLAVEGVDDAEATVTTGTRPTAAARRGHAAVAGGQRSGQVPVPPAARWPPRSCRRRRRATRAVGEPPWAGAAVATIPTSVTRAATTGGAVGDRRPG